MACVRPFSTSIFWVFFFGFVFALTSLSVAQDKVVVIPLIGNGATGNATINEVLNGKTFSNSSATGLTGTRPPVSVKKTGQNPSIPIDPAPSGSDGDLMKGAAWPNPRFTKNVNAADDDGSGGGAAGNGICDGTEACNGTVTDNLTGLTWLANADCPNATRDWATALSDVTNLNTDGTMNGNDCGDTSNGGGHQTDWRLPNRFELESLLHLGLYDPALPNTAGTGQWLPGDPFTRVRNSNYWSSTTFAIDTDGAWYVIMSDGRAFHWFKTDLYYVWAVRGD